MLWMIQHFLICASIGPRRLDMGHPFQEWTEEEEENLHPGL